MAYETLGDSDASSLQFSTLEEFAKPLPLLAPHGKDAEVALTNLEVDCSDAVLPRDGSDSFWFGSVDLLMLNARFSADSFAELGSDTIFAPRGIIGWESSRNLGVRARYWESSPERPVDGGTLGPLRLNINTSRFDVDLYRRFTIGQDAIIVGSGVTAAQMELELEPAVAFTNNGVGVQLFVEGYHLLERYQLGELNLFGRGRWAGLTGNWERSGFGTDIEANSNFDILEAAFGVEYRHRLKHADMLLQCSMESQQWNATYGEKLGYLGGVVSIGFER